MSFYTIKKNRYMNEEINAWLNSGQDYHQGVSLYERFGASASQKRLLRMGGPTAKNRSTLAYELKKLAKVQVKVQVKKPIIVVEEPKIIKKKTSTGRKTTKKKSNPAKDGKTPRKPKSSGKK
jgi:hypothetical protein